MRCTLAKDYMRVYGAEYIISLDYTEKFKDKSLREKDEIRAFYKKKMQLYIHIPFCKKKCSYCDFLSAPASKPRRQEYMQALMTEIMIWSGAAYIYL